MVTFFIIMLIINLCCSDNTNTNVKRKCKKIKKLHTKAMKYLYCGKMFDYTNTIYKLNSKIDKLLMLDAIIVFHCEFFINKQSDKIPVNVIDNLIKNINCKILKNDKFESYTDTVIKNNQEIMLKINKLEDYRKIKSLLDGMEIKFKEGYFNILGA